MDDMFLLETALDIVLDEDAELLEEAELLVQPDDDLIDTIMDM